MSEIISRSDWLYQEPDTLSDADIEDYDTDPGTPRDHPELQAVKVRQGAREYYEAAEDSDQLQEILTGYFNRTRDGSDFSQEVNEFMKQEYPDRFATIKEADNHGLGFAAKALAEDDILEIEVHDTSPAEDHPNAKLVAGVPHWECNSCNTVIRSISDDLVAERKTKEPTMCSVCGHHL